MADTIFLPILKDNHDPHYRYKMPKLTAKVEGNGNGIKTVLTNIGAVARSLGRPASYPTKYFGCELGAQVQMQDDLYIVNGSHDPDKLLNLLYAFIKRFVLCPKCSNPETDLSVSTGNVIKQKCIACGHATVIDRGAHRLTTFIISHPPGSSSSGTLSAGTNGGGEKHKNEKGKSEKKSSSKKHSKATNGNHEGGGKESNHKESSSRQKAENKNEREEENDDNGFGDDEDAFDDQELSEQAYLDRLHDGLATGMFIHDPKKSADVFFKLVKAKKEAGMLGDSTVQRELFKEATLLGIKDKASLILGELLFTQAMLDEIVTYRMLLLRFCNENRRAQKYLLGAYEKMVGEVHRDTLFPNATKILKQLYDQDIVEEETILEWASKESKKYVSKEMSHKIHERVAPFVKWLKEAEQAEDDEDDDDDDEDGSADDVASKTKSSKSGENGKRNQTSDESSPVEEESAHEDDGFVAFTHRVSGLHMTTSKTAADNREFGKSQLPNGTSGRVGGGGGEEETDDIDIDNI